MVRVTSAAVVLVSAYFLGGGGGGGGAGSDAGWAARASAGGGGLGDGEGVGVEAGVEEGLGAGLGVEEGVNIESGPRSSCRASGDAGSAWTLEATVAGCAAPDVAPPKATIRRRLRAQPAPRRTLETLASDIDESIDEY